jgi:nitrogen PTS system EIIA component
MPVTTPQWPIGAGIGSGRDYLGLTMNTLARICSTEDILLDVKVQNRHQLFDHIAQHVHQRLGLRAEQITKQLLEREKLGSTGLGEGVAIPHARVPGLRAAISLVVRPERSISFDAPDRKPVGEFILLLVPEHANQEHLQLLADAARLLCERAFREALRAAASPADVRRLLLDAQAA